MYSLILNYYSTNVSVLIFYSLYCNVSFFPTNNTFVGYYGKLSFITIAYLFTELEKYYSI